jgi:hypothetical protein
MTRLLEGLANLIGLALILWYGAFPNTRLKLWWEGV